MRIVIQGQGVVGSVTGQLLKAEGHDVEFHDPPKGVEATGPADACVVCTPCRDGFLDDPLYASKTVGKDGVVVVRSTVLPRALSFAAIPAWRRYYWPEFLTERTAEADAKNPDKLVWGADPAEPTTDVMTFVRAFLGRHYYRNRWRFIGTTLEAAAIAKLGLNTYYVIKVLLANALWDGCQDDEETFAAVLAILGMDKRVTVSHTDIYQDGYRGAGGKCLPKDIRLLRKVLEERGKAVTWDLLGDLVSANDRLLP